MSDISLSFFYASIELDGGYRAMYSGEIPIDPMDLHMDMDGDYPMDTYSDGVRAPYPDHMLA